MATVEDSSATSPEYDDTVAEISHDLLFLRSEWGRFHKSLKAASDRLGVIEKSLGTYDMHFDSVDRRFDQLTQILMRMEQNQNEIEPNAMSFEEIPLFVGDAGELRPWISSLETHFACAVYSESNKLALACGVLGGEAESFVHLLQSRFPFRSWNSLKTSLLYRFGGDDDPDKIRLQEQDRRSNERYRHFKAQRDAAEFLKAKRAFLSRGASHKVTAVDAAVSNCANEFIGTSPSQDMDSEVKISGTSDSVVEDESGKDETKLQDTKGPLVTTESFALTNSTAQMQMEDYASIMKADCIDQPAVSLLVLESGLSEKLLVDFETYRVFEVQKQAISEVVGPFFVDLQSGVDEFYEQTTGDNSTLYAYKVFDRIFLRGDVFGQAIQQKKRSKSWMFKYKAEIYVEGKLLIQLTYNGKSIMLEYIPYAREFIHFGKSFTKKGWFSFTGLFLFGGVNVWSTTVIWYGLTSTKNTESWLNPLFERNRELNQFMEQNHNNPVRTSYKITKMQWKAFLIQVLNPFGNTGVKSSKLGFLPIKLSGSLGSWVLSLVDTHTQLGIVGCVVVVMVERAQQSQVVALIGMAVLSLCSVVFMEMSKLYQGHQIHHLSTKQSLYKSRRFKFRIMVILLEEESLEDVVPRCDYLNFLLEFDPSVRDYTPDGISQVGSLFERAIPAVDFHVTEDNIIWEGYRELEQGILATVDKAGVGKGIKQIQEFRSIFQRHLSVPLENLSCTFVAYKAWEVEQGTDLDPGSDDLSKGSSQVTVANKKAQQMCSERVLFEGNISKKNEPDDTEGMQMTAERCLRCSHLIVGLRFIIQAGHGDRYQLECITCGFLWYASGDEVATLTIHNEQPAMSRSLWRAIFCVWYCGKDQILQHMGITEGLFHPFNLRITMLLLENSFWLIEKDKRQNVMGMMMVARLRHTNLLIQLTWNLLLLLYMEYKTVNTGGHEFFAIWHRWRIRDCVQCVYCIMEQCFLVFSLRTSCI